MTEVSIPEYWATQDGVEVKRTGEIIELVVQLDENVTVNTELSPREASIIGEALCDLYDELAE